VADIPGRGGEVNVVNVDDQRGANTAGLQRTLAGRQQGVGCRSQDQHPASGGLSHCQTAHAHRRWRATGHPLHRDQFSYSAISNVSEVECADLTPYFSGDAVKEYPNLANFPTLAWKQVIYNNAIYGVPVPYPLYLWVHWVHQNLLDDEGLSRTEKCEEYKNPRSALHAARPEPVGDGCRKQRRFGRDQRLAERYFRDAEHLGAGREDRKLTAHVRPSSFRAAVSMPKTVTAGISSQRDAVQPGQRPQRLRARRFAFRFDGFQSASITFWDNAPNLTPGQARIMAPFPLSVGWQAYVLASMPAAILGFSVVKQASPDRIKGDAPILTGSQRQSQSGILLMNTA